MTWAERARPYIDQVLLEYPDLNGKQLRAKLRQAYPFGERSYHPYKIWLRLVKQAVHERLHGRLPVRPRSCEIPGQGVLL